MVVTMSAAATMPQSPFFLCDADYRRRAAVPPGDTPGVPMEGAALDHPARSASLISIEATRRSFVTVTGAARRLAAHLVRRRRHLEACLSRLNTSNDGCEHRYPSARSAR